MTSADARAQVTIARDTIHHPDEPRHFMRIKPVRARVRVLRGGRVLAESERARRLLEAGRDLYDPVLYFPAADVRGDAVAGREADLLPAGGPRLLFRPGLGRRRGRGPGDRLELSGGVRFRRRAQGPNSLRRLPGGGRGAAHGSPQGLVIFRHGTPQAR